MAHQGAPEVPRPNAEGARVAVVSTRWNEKIVALLHERAVSTARELGAKVDEYWVSGAFELPVLAQACARRYDAVVALGCVIRGETAHFTYVCESVTSGLTRVALDEETPVGNGVLTVDDEDQALERAGGEDAKEDKGAEAVLAALGALDELAKVRQLAPKQTQTRT
ncbi:6,7-dimethyl-8-ribityllumazine synthase [Corynebacterium liangguodongii]|uniref:6,7-dimethyl-8-ribityllumazine synthase n=1 Tax=Corynebacterium liangguodongii TaxID=2079535 RepID=A0A2S0WEH6_9CORY|nr:6,7-dimethyl-8-ribityllumazine synthase [Corynebacterium liangguodongii]AWB84062.1 6,7-dimethyl-8-ribityllumazine synthase [Corynebacterium liangguodongii]PWC00073.1 6,7-dimethyl-8-ribityllumazine synthase [Corynebacterium liangguodongii]